MICSLADCERIAELAKRLLAERKKYERRSNGRHDDLTSKQAQKLNVDLNWAAMEIDKIERQLHVACVDAGIADLREPSHYAERHYHPSGWHHYIWTPPQPVDLDRYVDPTAPLILVLAEIRAVLGVGERPMMTELPGIISERIKAGEPA